jgi:hypothetical protein
MTKGALDTACPKLEESFRLDPVGGTALNLALCHEKQRKLATAYTDFKTALSLARRDGRADRAAAAEEHIHALEPEVPQLTIVVAGAVPGQEVIVDGAALREAGWGEPVALDPGQHEVAASAPGKKRWAVAMHIGERERKTIQVPSLQTDAAAQTGKPPEPDEKSGAAGEEESGGGRKTAGWIVGGAGLAALGVGTYYGIQAITKRNESDAHCPTDTTCDAQGVELNNEAQTAAWIANFGVGLGIAGIAVGTYLLVTGGAPSPDGSEAKRRGGVSVSAHLAPTGGGLGLRGSF